jgi:hypothetical protein
MADIIDDANQTAEFFLAAALQNLKQNASKETPGVGACLNCGAAVEGEKRWCDADCRDQWQADQDRKQRL